MPDRDSDLYLTVIKAIRGNVDELRAETVAHRAQIQEIEKGLFRLTSEMSKLTELALEVKELTKTLGGSCTEVGLIQRLRDITKQDDDLRKELAGLQDDLKKLKRNLMIGAVGGGLALASTQDISRWIHILKLLL